MLASGADVSLPPQLGMLEVHRPLSPWKAFALSSVPGCIIGAGMLWSPHLPWWSGVLAFLGATLMMLGIVSEWLFIEHRLYERGLVLDSVIPATPNYLIPYATVDVESVRAAGRQPIPEQDRLRVFENRKYRQSPATNSVLFTSITPSEARRLAKLKAPEQAWEWDRLVTAFARLPNSDIRLRAGEQWAIGFRDHHEAARRLAAAATREQRLDG